VNRGGGSTIVMADDGVPFDGASLDAGPLGGAETAFIGLAQGLAARGHRVLAFTRTTRHVELGGVFWHPIDSAMPDHCDLYIANRGSRVLDRMPGARRIAFWVHNPARYMLKARYLWRLLRRRPAIVFVGQWQASTLPGWVPGRDRRVIPLGLNPVFRGLARRSPPSPRAIFTSNPLRRLDWLLDRWAREIRPAVPGATLHVHSSLATYGDLAPKHQAAVAPILARATALADQGVVLAPPLAKPALAQALAQARVFLYGGDPGETFCLAAAESQAAGVPAVVARSTCLAERVRDGDTGFVVGDDDDEAFSSRAIDLLRDDALWQAQHDACRENQQGLDWTEVAALWEELLP
jgi:glycosyltransferase involved in cell wall biosynthesis